MPNDKVRTTSTLTPAGERWVAATSKPLDVLALIFLVDFILIWGFPDAPAGVQRVMILVSWLVWAGFAIDYFARLLLSRPRGAFVRTHKLDLLMVLLPMLRVMRVFLLLRRSLSAVSTEKIAGSIVSIIVAIVLIAAFLEWRVEYDAPGASITTFRAAIWWAVVTITTVGYGDYSPVTPLGRIIAMVLMVVGIGLIGTVSATVAAWFVNRRADAADQQDDVEDANQHAALLARLDALAAQQDEIRALLRANSPSA